MMTTDITLLPSSDRLLSGVRKALQKVASRTEDAQTLMELTSVDFALSELQMRTEVTFYRDYYAKLFDLVETSLLFVENLGLNEFSSEAKASLASLPGNVEDLILVNDIGVNINRLLDCLAQLVGLIGTVKSESAASLLEKIADTEHGFHNHRLQSEFAISPSASSEGDMDLSVDTLTRYLQEKFPERPGIRVTSLNQLVGGYQKTTVLFDTVDESGLTESLVIRAEKEQRFLTLSASDVITEIEFVKYVSDKGYPVAEPLWLEPDKNKLGQRFFVSRKMPGINLGTAKDSSGINDDVAYSFVEKMAQLHAIDIHADKHRLPFGHWANYDSLADTTKAYVALWRDQPWLATAEPSPLRRRVLQWLTDNVPKEDGRLCFIHSDFGPHNVLVDDGKVTAVLDWEAVRIGDPAEEISWFLQSSGGVDKHKVLDWYAQEAGERISEYRIAYYDILNLYKQMVSFACAASMYQATPDAGMEWVNFPLRWMAHATTAVEEKIAEAESYRKS